MMSKIIINYIYNTHKYIQKQKKDDEDLIIELLKNNNGYIDSYEKITFKNDYCQEIFFNCNDDKSKKTIEEINEEVIKEGKGEIKCIEFGELEETSEIYFIYEYKKEEEKYLIIVDKNNTEIDLSVFSFIKDIYKYLNKN